MTLGRVAAVLVDAADAWWVIGSAAVALHGADPGKIGDVDVLLSVADARRVIATLGLSERPRQASDRFRSMVFARWSAAPLPVEFMAGFDAITDGHWRPVEPRTRLAVGGVFVPDRDELATILRGFGRDKDRRRAVLLAQSAGRSIDQKRGPPPGTRHSPVTAKPSPA